MLQTHTPHTLCLHTIILLCGSLRLDDANPVSTEQLANVSKQLPPRSPNCSEFPDWSGQSYITGWRKAVALRQSALTRGDLISNCSLTRRYVDLLIAASATALCSPVGGRERGATVFTALKRSSDYRGVGRDHPANQSSYTLNHYQHVSDLQTGSELQLQREFRTTPAGIYLSLMCILSPSGQKTQHTCLSLSE